MKFEFQISPISFEAGGEQLRGFAELGFGNYYGCWLETLLVKEVAQWYNLQVKQNLRQLNIM